MGEKNTLILYDDAGEGSVMVKIPKFKISDVIEGGIEVVHPAFVVNGEEKDFIYISKYQNVVKNERAYSLKGEDPAVLYSPCQMEQFCRNKGKNWHLMTNAEWAAAALYSLKNGTLPRGNNDNGRDWSHPEESGILSSLKAVVPAGEEGPPMRTATGSGPETWSHDGTADGIFDMNGNVFELVSGIRLYDGFFEVIENNDAAAAGLCLESERWSRIGEDGNLINPRSESPALRMRHNGLYAEDLPQMQLDFGTTKKQNLEKNIEDVYLPFREVAAPRNWEKGNIAEQLAILPSANSAVPIGCELAWGMLQGVRYPIRGGYWVNGKHAGIFMYGFYMQEEDRYFDVGFRSCYFD